MAADNGQPPYTVSVPQFLRERFRPWLELARRLGMSASYVADLKLLDRQLLYSPATWGDPLWDLPNARLQIRRGMTDHLIVIYGVHFDQPLVFVRDLVLRPGRPMANAEDVPPPG